MSFSRTLAEILCQTRFCLAQCHLLLVHISHSPSPAVLMRLRTVGQCHLVLESCCAVCILQKMGLTWVVRRPGTYHSILAELSVVHQSCPMWRIFSSFLTCPQHQIAAPPFFVHRSQWTFERELYMLSEGFPFSHQISTIPIKCRIT